jgi:hypothetical protein
MGSTTNIRSIQSLRRGRARRGVTARRTRASSLSMPLLLTDASAV